MATSTSILCGICEARHVTTCAEHWCPECEEGLCAECLEHHSLSKASRKHEVISIENYKKLPEFILDACDSCKEHGLKFTNYCQHHDQLCCPGCINISHKKCEDLQPLADLFQNSKTSSLISFLDERLGEVLKCIAQGVKDRTQNISYLSKQQQSIRDEITQIRSKINSHLDTLERSMIKSVTDIHTKTTTDIQVKINQLSEKSNEIKKLKDNLLAVKEYGSDLQTFFGARRLEDEVNREATYFKSTFDYKYFHFMKITSTIDQKVIDILGLKSFGKVEAETGPSALEFKTREEKEAQIKSEVNLGAQKSINDIQLKLLSSFEIHPEKKHNFLSGCTVSPAGKMIFTERNNKRLIVLNSDNSYDKVITIASGYGPYDVTVIDEQTVAVTTEEGIKIVDIKTIQIKKCIKTDQLCFGITFDGNSLTWCEKYGGIKNMALQGGKIYTILQKQFPSLHSDSYVASYGGKIYLTDNYNDNKMESCTLDGKEEWKFKDTSILSQPHCIAVDNNMRIYTTNSNNVTVISPDGKQGRQLLSRKDGIQNPKGICFDRARNNLIITNRNGTVFLYHVE